MIQPIPNSGTYTGLWSLALVLASVVLAGGVCTGAGMCDAVGPLSGIFLRLSGERSGSFLSVPVGDLDPDLHS